MYKLSLLAMFAFAFNLYEEGDDVVQIVGKDHFDTVLKENPLALVEFYAPWCGHCKNLAPEYKKAATKLKEHKIALLAVDATLDDNKSLSSEYGVSGFPTLKVFNNKFGSGMTD